MATQSNFPAIRPTLNLDFVNSKTVDPRITFIRSDSSSIARFYDGKTVAKAEENLFTYSEQFDNSAWNVNDGVSPAGRTVVANAVQAPDGSITADQVTFAAQFSAVGQSVSFVSGASYTISFWAKSGTSTNTLTVLDSVGNTVLGTFVPTSSWVRYSFTFTASSTASRNLYLAQDRNASGFGSIYLWGAQLEQRSSVTAYTPTTTQPITNYIPVLQTAAAGVPRIDHDPVTGECKGLLIEEQRTNLLTYSEQFDNVLWVSSGAGTTVTANATTAPDGNSTADKIVEVAAAGTHGRNQVVTAANGTYTFSVYLKAAERSRVRLDFTDQATGDVFADFNLITGQYSNITTGGSWTAASAYIVNAGGGWYRCTLTATKGAGVAAVPVIYFLNNTGEFSYTGDGYSGIYIWGAQLEAGAFPTSYIKTEASQVTRSADSASMTGTNFTSWYRQDEWTLFAEAESSATGGTSSQAGGLFTIYGIGSDRISAFVGAAGSVRYESVVGGAVPFGLNNGLVSPNVFYKLTAGYKANDFALASNNSSVVATDNSGSVMQNAIGLQFGSVFATGQLNGHIKRIVYYPKRLSNSELQALTS